MSRTTFFMTTRKKNPLIPRWMVPIFIFLVFPAIQSEEESARDGLVEFMNKLLSENTIRGLNWGWNSTSDPCNDMWEGISCDPILNYVKNITLDNSNLSGFLDSVSLCKSGSLEVLSLKNNNISGLIQEEISTCQSLKELFLRGNHFSGQLPRSLSLLSSLKRLDIAYNELSGELPEGLPKISELLSFHAENNKLSGRIVEFNFSNLEEFNVSNNGFTGPIPDVKGRFTTDSFKGNNPELCGLPLSNICPDSNHDQHSVFTRSKKHPNNQLLIYSGYVIVVVIIVIFLMLKLFSKGEPKNENVDVENTKSKTKDIGMGAYTTFEESCPVFFDEFGMDENRSGYSLASIGSLKAASPLTVVSTLDVKGLTFEDLLGAPAELLKRGKHGSTYKVMLENGSTLAVKRIKGWEIPNVEFERRMKKINQVKHPNILPQVAYYCSRQEKLLIYEYQHNGSLFHLLHETEHRRKFVWGSRLAIASYIGEALSFMFKELQEDGIAHGNLKSCNILFNKNMDPCISEYGLMPVFETEAQDRSIFVSPTNSFTMDSPFHGDVYDLGVILLELLTGKVVDRKGFDLSTWVQSAVREEWTVDIFDKALIIEGANEERMVNLLQVALKCINPCGDERPSVCEVAVMLNSIREEEDDSISFKP